MLRKTIYCYLLAKHAAHAFHMKLCPVDCNECVVPTAVAESPAQNVQPVPLYPDLTSENEWRKCYKSSDKINLTMR